MTLFPNRKRRADKRKGPDTSTWTQEMIEEKEKEDRLATPVAEMEMSVRTINALEKFGIIIARDLVRQNCDSIVNIPNLGDKSIREMKSAIVALKLPSPSWSPPKALPKSSKIIPIVDVWTG